VIGHRGVNEGFTPACSVRPPKRSSQMSAPIFVSTKRFATIANPLLAYDGSQRASSAMESAAEFCTVLKLPLTVLTIAREESAAQAILQQAKAYLGSYAIDAKYEIARGYPEPKKSSSIWSISNMTCCSSAPMAIDGSSRWCSRHHGICLA